MTRIYTVRVTNRGEYYTPDYTREFLDLRKAVAYFERIEKEWTEKFGDFEVQESECKRHRICTAWNGFEMQVLDLKY